MTRVNSRNERVKRKFFQWLKEADGNCDSTVDNIEKAICIYEDFSKHEDFIKYNPDKAIEFKKWLSKRDFRGKPISLTTYCTYLRYLKKFFLWLSWQNGYKSKISPDKVDYLKVTEKEERIASQSSPRNYPPLDYVLKLTSSIQINSEVDLRDRALISFALLSGMRDKAISTLPLGCFNEEALLITQNPRQGVETKFSKFIPTTLINFNDTLLDYVLEWVKHLKAKGFGSQDPFFPRSKTEITEDNLSFEQAKHVEPVYWQGAGRIREIFKKRSGEAKLPYFPPHTYRHLAVDLALRFCKTGEQIKAVSQNFGHEHVATTLSSYANFDNNRLSDIIKHIDFSGKPKETLEEKVEELLRRIDKRA